MNNITNNTANNTTNNTTIMNNTVNNIPTKDNLTTLSDLIDCGKEQKRVYQQLKSEIDTYNTAFRELKEKEEKLKKLIDTCTIKREENQKAIDALKTEKASFTIPLKEIVRQKEEVEFCLEQEAELINVFNLSNEDVINIPSEEVVETNTSIPSEESTDEVTPNLFSDLEEMPTILNYCSLNIETENNEEAVSIADSVEPPVRPTVTEDTTEDIEDIICTNQDFIREIGEPRPTNQKAFDDALYNNLVLMQYISSLDENQVEQFCLANQDIISIETRETEVIPLALWKEGTLKDALDASHSVFDEECLEFLRHFCKEGSLDIFLYKPFAFRNYLHIVKQCVSNPLFNENDLSNYLCFKYVKHGLLQYFYKGYYEQMFEKVNEKEAKNIGYWFQGESYKTPLPF